LDFIGKPAPFCRYCDSKRRSCDNPWRVLRRKLGEYAVLPQEK
jgi:hypothetical protein